MIRLVSESRGCFDYTAVLEIARGEFWGGQSSRFWLIRFNASQRHSDESARRNPSGNGTPTREIPGCPLGAE